MNKRIYVYLFVLTTAFTAQSHSYQTIEGSTILFSDILLWKLREGSNENWAQEISPSGLNQTVKLLDVPFDWQAGFRVGIGFDCPLNHWDTLVSYTRYQTNYLSQKSVSSGGIYSAFLGNFYVNNADGANFGPNYLDAGIEWKFLFNNVDFEFGRTFKIDHLLTLRPFIGLKTALINQSINTSWQNPSTPTNFTSAVENLKNDFWGMGPYIGLDTTWPLYCNISRKLNLFGNVSGGILSGHWRFKDRYENDTPLSVTVHSSHINSAATMATTQFGIEWAERVLRSDLTIRLGYEAQIWFNQIQYYSFNMGRLDNLMSLQGGLLDFYVKF